MSTALIRLDQVAVTFAGQNVLDNIQLSVEPGQIVTLIGPNGAGKTTLVRAVLGLLKPTSGSVWRKPRLRVGRIGGLMGSAELVRLEAKEAELVIHSLDQPPPAKLPLTLLLAPPMRQDCSNTPLRRWPSLSRPWAMS